MNILKKPSLIIGSQQLYIELDGVCNDLEQINNNNISLNWFKFVTMQLKISLRRTKVGGATEIYKVDITTEIA